MKEQALNKDTIFQKLPPVWPESPLDEIRSLFLQSGRRLIVLDDDPTGTQTVYDLPLLTEWSVDVLAEELQKSVVFFILTNSRSLSESAAAARNREIGQNLKAAAEKTSLEFFVLSRSDSTLRGHYPAEVDALCDGVGRTYDSTVMVPFFEAGGRFTIDNIHYVAQNDQLIPAAQTEFSQDKSFPYSYSYLPAYVEEKTKGKIKAEQVYGISIQSIRSGGPQAVFKTLMTVPPRSVIVINACEARDMEVAVKGLLQAQNQGKTYLYRTAASFVRVLIGLPLKPLLNARSMAIETPYGGLMIVGSHIKKSSLQLDRALALKDVYGLEIDVVGLLDPKKKEKLLQSYITTLNAQLKKGIDVIAYTSRRLIYAPTPEDSLKISRTVSEGLCQIVQGIALQPKFIIAKGGITSNDIATIGLNVKRAIVSGQLQPGVPVWQLGPESRFPAMHYVVYPGNVGSETGLAEAIAAFHL